MTSALGPLRRGLWLWLPPAIALAAGLFFLARHVASGGEAGGSLERRHAAAIADRDGARAEEDHLAGLARAEEANRLEIEQLYHERFSTESNRFTDLVREIRRLAEHSGLDPTEIGYPEETLDGYGLSRRSFVFSVEGSFSNLRMFLHLLELSPSFVTVNEIRVSERKGTGVSIRLQLSTFFADPEAAADKAGGVS